MISFCCSSSLSNLHISPNTNLQNHPTLTLLSKCKNLDSLKQIHSQFIKFGLHNTRFAVTKLVHFCAISPFGDLNYALSVFENVQEPNLIMWNTLIRGYSMTFSPHLAIEFYIYMIFDGVEPNSYTFPFVLKSCAKIGSIIGKQVHGHVLKLGLEDDAFVHTSLINMYAQNGELGYARLVFDKNPRRDVVSFTALITGYCSRGFMDDARNMFDEMHSRDIVSWNALISGYARSGQFEEAPRLFEEMIRENVKPNESTLVSVLSACAKSGSLGNGIWVRAWIDDHGFGSNHKIVNALIDMYSKCGDLNRARDFFDGLHYKDVISWNVMIGGYTHGRLYKDALALFRDMQRSKEAPNAITFLTILPVCACLGALDLGKWIHAYVDKNNLNFENTSLWTSLIDMYAKCGNIKAAQQVFSSMKTKSLASWNAMISGLTMHGHANEAFELFSEMIEEGFTPDDITFVGVLSACSQTGLVDHGRRYFHSMIHDFNISPKVHHYGCLIDLLGRAGLFDEAQAFMKNMEMDPDAAIWSSLLGACINHKNIELGEFAAGNLFKLEPENPGPHVLLSNLYAKVGRWEDVEKTRTTIYNNKMKKSPGCSSIEVDSVVHEFLVGDHKAHPKGKEIHNMLVEIDQLLEMSGFLPDTSEVNFDMDEEWKEGILCHHSEKLAIAFGLISTKPGTTIRIVKNLRVCGNCHSATKLISKIFNREIIARDRNRFHHFKDGSCSCMDYW